jgi:hypothetical protein
MAFATCVLVRNSLDPEGDRSESGDWNGELSSLERFSNWAAAQIQWLHGFGAEPGWQTDLAFARIARKLPEPQDCAWSLGIWCKRRDLNSATGKFQACLCRMQSPRRTMAHGGQQRRARLE